MSVAARRRPSTGSPLPPGGTAFPGFSRSCPGVALMLMRAGVHELIISIYLFILLTKINKIVFLFESTMKTNKAAMVREFSVE